MLGFSSYLIIFVLLYSVNNDIKHIFIKDYIDEKPA